MSTEQTASWIPVRIGSELGGFAIPAECACGDQIEAESLRKKHKETETIDT